ncbi:MAG: LysE family translocator [Roseobacter sp.]|jgi:threonine/homoserine/homoserine lactone efflux protein
MVDALSLAAFIPAALALNLTPGADMMLCVAQGMRHGPRAAWLASAGVATGGIIHVLVAGLGLSALLAREPLAFDVIRWVGVAYLLWLALKALRGSMGPVKAPPAKKHAAYTAGLFVNLLNPKVILFVLAFIPQFVLPEAGPVVVQFFVFGAVMASGGFLVNGLVGTWAGNLGRKLVQGSRLLDILAAGIFTALALRLALIQRT